MMKKEYVEKRGGGYYVAGTRVSLDSIVYSFRDGASPESIRCNFSGLTLEDVYGAITYYLHNQKKIDKYLIDSEIEFEKQAEQRKKELKRLSPDLYKRLKQKRDVVR